VMLKTPDIPPLPEVSVATALKRERRISLPHRHVGSDRRRRPAGRLASIGEQESGTNQAAMRS